MRNANLRVTKMQKLFISALVGFCLLCLLDWTGIFGRGFPKNWSEAFIQICVNIGWTLLFTITNYFVLVRSPRQSDRHVDPSLRVPEREKRTDDSRADPMV